MLLEAGNLVAADGRLVSEVNLRTQEAALTGESVPVEKNTLPLSKPDLSPGDQLCMAFSGTFVTRGSSRGVVIGTAENTEFGKIATLVKSTRKTATPLQRKIGQFVKTRDPVTSLEKTFP